jgi:hypothetical protein
MDSRFFVLETLKWSEAGFGYTDIPTSWELLRFGLEKNVKKVVKRSCVKFIP